MNNSKKIKSGLMFEDEPALHVGKISVKSKLNMNSDFTFNLTFNQSNLWLNVNSFNSKSLPGYPLTGLKVLVVEDNYFNQMLAVKILENWQCKVEVAGDGKIAIEMAEKNNFDIILMDIQLPEMDGYETTWFIRNKMPSHKSNIPIIAMTAHAFVTEAKKCQEAKMNDYISKPFDENKLYDKIIKVLKRN
jgi:CheY-like chemotaxis protein